MAPDRSAGVQQGREWTILVCPVCGEREEDDHLCEHLSGDWSDAGVWIPAKHEAETVRVVEAVSPEPREGERAGEGSLGRSGGTSCAAAADGQREVPPSPAGSPAPLPEPQEPVSADDVRGIFKDYETPDCLYCDATAGPAPDPSVARVLRLTASRLRDPEYRWYEHAAVTLERLAEKLESGDE